MSNHHHDFYKPFEYILGRAHKLLLTSGERIYFKAMELEEDPRGRFHLKGYDSEQAWRVIAANEIVYAARPNKYTA